MSNMMNIVMNTHDVHGSTLIGRIFLLKMKKVTF